MSTNLVTKGYKFRIYPNNEQVILMNKTFGCCRFIYNYFLNYKQTLWREHKKIVSKFDLVKMLPNIKNSEEFNWLREVDSKALQASIENLDSAYQNFFKLKKGYPKFKSKKNRQSYTTKNVNNCIKINNNYIQIPKIGWIKFDNHLEIQGKIKKITISKSKSNKYYVSICCDNVKVKELDKTGSLIGIDLGIKSFLIDSNGNKIINFNFYRNTEKKLKKLQRQLSRKPKDSKNWEKTRIKLAELSERTTNQRKDFQHKLSTQIVKDNDIICIENLNIKGMQKNHRLAKAIQDVNWSNFINYLQYKCDWYGKKLIKIDRFYPSSKSCNVCGYTKQGLGLKDRFWTCPICNTIHDRDINAAKNILNEGLRLLDIH